MSASWRPAPLRGLAQQQTRARPAWRRGPQRNAASHAQLGRVPGCLFGYLLAVQDLLLRFHEILPIRRISKAGDRRVRSLLYEAANVLLTRTKGELKLKSWALAIARRSTMRQARVALARCLAIIMHAMLRHGTEFRPA